DEDQRAPQDLIGRDRVLARRSPVRLRLSVDDFPADRIASLRYQVNDEAAHDLGTASGRERSAGLNLARGQHRVRAVLRTDQDPPQEYTKELLVQVVPPAPAIKAGTGRSLTVKEPAVQWRGPAGARPAGAGREMRT